MTPRGVKQDIASIYMKEMKIKQNSVNFQIKIENTPQCSFSPFLELERGPFNWGKMRAKS